MLLGAQKHQLGPLRSRMGPMSDIFFSCFVILGPSKKNNGPNPMSFQFLVGGTLGPHESWPLPWENLGYATGRYLTASSVMHLRFYVGMHNSLCFG